MDSISIPQAQIAVKKTVGKTDGHPVTYVKTVGGLHLITNHRGTVIGSGPHRQVARHIAARHADIEWTELSKADHLPLEAYQHLLPEYEELTKQLRAAQGQVD